MKPFTTLSALVLMSVSACLFSVAALANEPADSCAKWTASAVLDQAKKDFPGRSLATQPIDMGGWDGGYVTDLDVTIVESSNPADTVAVYRVMIDETCAVISGPDRE